jgi:NADH:ubiquinone oxidoreductase subunit
MYKAAPVRNASLLDEEPGECHIIGHVVEVLRSGGGMTTAITRAITMFKGELVGNDHLGNKYYHERKVPPAGRRRKRWVVYNGEDEASRVPPEWHAWLHYTIDAVPENAGKPHRDWQKEHVANQTGTAQAYRPPGHTLAGGQRAKATGDYDAWTPE